MLIHSNVELCEAVAASAAPSYYYRLAHYFFAIIVFFRTFDTLYTYISFEAWSRRV